MRVISLEMIQGTKDFLTSVLNPLLNLGIFVAVSLSATHTPALVLTSRLRKCQDSLGEFQAIQCCKTEIYDTVLTSQLGFNNSRLVRSVFEAEANGITVGHPSR